MLLNNIFTMWYFYCCFFVCDVIFIIIRSVLLLCLPRYCRLLFSTIYCLLQLPYICGCDKLCLLDLGLNHWLKSLGVERMEPDGTPQVKLLKADPGPLISVTQSSKFSLVIVHSYWSFSLKETVLRGLGNIPTQASLADLITVLISESYSMI